MERGGQPWLTKKTSRLDFDTTSPSPPTFQNIHTAGTTFSLSPAIYRLTSVCKEGKVLKLMRIGMGRAHTIFQGPGSQGLAQWLFVLSATCGLRFLPPCNAPNTWRRLQRTERAWRARSTGASGRAFAAVAVLPRDLMKTSLFTGEHRKGGDRMVGRRGLGRRCLEASSGDSRVMSCHEPHMCAKMLGNC